MASPPNLALSPPSTHSALPSKRPASTANPASSQKRRKHSTTTSVSSLSHAHHPLRQTSFPPEEGSALAASRISHARSPSVSSSVTGGGTGAKRGRKRKSIAPTAPSATGSVGGRAGNGTAVGSDKGTSVEGRTTTGADGDAAADGDDDDDEEMGGEVSDGDAEKADKKQREKQQGILLEALTPSQRDRYDLYRRGKLNAPTVRKITNQTLSQSVPDLIVKTINGFTKVFIGEIVEKAREVQHEWLQAEMEARAEHQHQHPPPLHAGPLLPSHLREALRRYKNDAEGGGAGLRGLSLTGMRGMGGVPVREVGRKLAR